MFKSSFIISLLVSFCFLVPAIGQEKQEKKSFKSQKELEIAFARDNYEVTKVVHFQGQKGLMAEHKTAVNYETKRRKRVFYVEGNSYQMGFLMGLLAEDDIELMSTEFVDNIIFDFINADVDPKKIPIIWGILKGMMLEGAKTIRPDIPDTYIQEMSGLVNGCIKANPKSKVTFNNLLLLNVGFDAILSHAYALNKVEISGLDVEDLEIPVLCNAFSVFGKATVNGKHYFGRDFMFPTANVFEHMACMTIYCPDNGQIPMVSVAAPGFVGAIATMNIEGVGMGVDMVPGNACNPKRPGLNSLMMVRHATAYGSDAQKALDVVEETQRGVTWLYFIADGKTDRAVAVESAQKTDSLDVLQYPLDKLKSLKMLPDQNFLNRYENQKHLQGLMVRWNDYKYPEQFSHFNNGLFEHHEKKQSSKSWGERGFINRHSKEKNCPETFYFAPQRENRDDVLIITNHYIVPSMRLSAMSSWTQAIAGKKQDAIQWRYDELNSQILANYGEIDEEKAKDLIDFLGPNQKFPDHYKGNKKSTDGKTNVMRGSISLCNLSDRVIHSYYGYYKDEWITLTLPNYVAD